MSTLYEPGTTQHHGVPGGGQRGAHPAWGSPPAARQAVPQLAGRTPSGRPDLTTMSTPTERGFATAAHLSGFVAAWFALGFLGPLAVLLLGGRSGYVRRHAIEAINANLSFMIYGTIAWALAHILIGWLFLPPLAIAYTVSTLLAARAAHHGRSFRYPMTIRFLRA